MKRFNTESVAGKVALKSRLASALLLILSVLILTSAASAAELVVNGDFELPVVDTDLGWVTYYGENYPLTEPGDCDKLDSLDPQPANCNDDKRVPGWSVFWTKDDTGPGIPGEPLGLSPGRLEIQTGTTAGTPAYNHSLQKAELDSHHRIGSENNNVAISQLLPTCPLTGYSFTYAWKSRTQVPGDNDVRVYVNDEEVGMHQQNSGWQKEEWYFVADTFQTLIWFDSVGTETTRGMFLDEVSVTGPDGSYEDPCTLICDDKPRELTLRYDGEDDSNHHQTGNEVIIVPEDVIGTFPDPAIIKVYGHKRKNPKFLGSFEVKIDGLFSVSGPHKRIPPRLTFKIYDPDDLVSPVQTVTFHTSCSQPMDAGDEFGAITVWSAIN